MAFFFRSQRGASFERPVAPSAPSGWYESSFELLRGLELVEDVSFEEYERLCAQEPASQPGTTRPQDRSPRPR